MATPRMEGPPRYNNCYNPIIALTLSKNALSSAEALHEIIKSDHDSGDMVVSEIKQVVDHLHSMCSLITSSLEQIENQETASSSILKIQEGSLSNRIESTSCISEKENLQTRERLDRDDACSLQSIVDERRDDIVTACTSPLSPLLSKKRSWSFRRKIHPDPIAKAAKEAFHLIDANGDGFLQREEVLLAMEEMKRNDVSLVEKQIIVSLFTYTYELFEIGT